MRRAFSSEYIRNFCIIAHIDHGKSTLADRFIELTGNRVTQPQVLDRLEVERRRGITVRAQTVTMNHERFLLNLIDTPGHVDFSYEVSRSLSACEGALLLVDAIAGVQAQTFTTFYQAMDAGIKILPVINKIDHPSAVVLKVQEQLLTHFGLEKPYLISALRGLGVPELLTGLIKEIQYPHGLQTGPFRGLLFDSWYEPQNGVVCVMKIIDGAIRKKAAIKSLNSGKIYSVVQMGYIRLALEPTEELKTGEVGYFVLNMKQTAEALIGDTFCLVDEEVEPFPGFKEPKCMVYAGVFPEDTDKYEDLLKAIERLSLEDRGLVRQKELNPALGLGFRCGFLGVLHMDIIKERLKSEYGQSVIVTAPSVPYKILKKDDTETIINNANDMPDKFDVREIHEPMVEITIMIPNEYISTIISLCMSRRGIQTNSSSIDQKTTLVKFKMPLAEIILDFFDTLKSVTRGMGTLDYEYLDYEVADLGKLTILVNNEIVDSLSSIAHKESAYNIGKSVCSKLKDLLPRQMFDVPVQAAYNGRVIARQTIKAYRKDVTAKLYGGDQTRKDKLLKKQKKGKKRMKTLGNMNVETSVFAKILQINK